MTTTWRDLPTDIRLRVQSALPLPDAHALSETHRDPAITTAVRARTQALSSLRNAWVAASSPSLRTYANPPHLHTRPARAALSIRAFLQLTTLPLSGTGLRSLAAVGELRHLRVLDASRNALTVVDGSLRRCAQLRVLDLSDNVLREVPTVVLTLPELRTLVLHRNPIGVLPEGWSALPKLRCLGLFGCAIRGGLPEELCRMLGTVSERRRRSADLQRNRLDAERICKQFRRFPLLESAVVI